MNAKPLITKMTMSHTPRPISRASGDSDPGGPPTGDQPGHDGGQDAADAERLGRQVGGERGQQRDA